MNSISQWYQLLEDDHMNWELRLIFSDWLEENGLEDQSKYQRWAVREKRSPWRAHTASKSVMKSSSWPKEITSSWDWVVGQYETYGIPLNLNKFIQDPEEEEFHYSFHHKEFPTLVWAEEAILKGLKLWSKDTNIPWTRWTLDSNDGWILR